MSAPKPAFCPDIRSGFLRCLLWIVYVERVGKWRRDVRKRAERMRQ